ncbi:hypothetical protein F2Q69_00043978 [Brassica cretica]|uniref:Uncharacterized protein n=1 Tax=Brassica cretica TaxID=69181 RepID=A0A8S9NQ53_BRACR|nr:hypothetical protein F2Q69_00043978 [Brassica cretica]
MAHPVAKSRSKVFDFLKNCGVCIGVGHRRSGAGVFLPALLRIVIFSFIFPDIVLIKHFVAMS